MSSSSTSCDHWPTVSVFPIDNPDVKECACGKVRASCSPMPASSSISAKIASPPMKQARCWCGLISREEVLSGNITSHGFSTCYSSSGKPRNHAIANQLQQDPSLAMRGGSFSSSEPS
jgi:hypothetical protein